MALASMSDFKAPPRAAAAAKRESTTKAATVKGKTAAREEAANGIFQLAGFGCIITRQYADAGAINLHGAPVAHELALLAEKNTSIGKGLDYLMEAGPYAGLITALMPLVLQLMANHKVIRADMVSAAGVVPPEALTADVKAHMARQAHEALMAQRAAEAQLADFQAATHPEPMSANGSEAAHEHTGA